MQSKVTLNNKPSQFGYFMCSSSSKPAATHEAFISCIRCAWDNTCFADLWCCGGFYWELNNFESAEVIKCCIFSLIWGSHIPTAISISLLWFDLFTANTRKSVNVGKKKNLNCNGGWIVLIKIILHFCD